jgi:hypothetical protein
VGHLLFARNVTQLLRDALQLKAEKPDLPPATFVERAAALEERFVASRHHPQDNGLQSDR